MDRWHRIAEDEGLCKGTEEYRHRRSKFLGAEVTKDFLRHFGDQESSIKAWRSLCVTIGIEGSGTFGSVEACQSVRLPLSEVDLVLTPALG